MHVSSCPVQFRKKLAELYKDSKFTVTATPSSRRPKLQFEHSNFVIIGSVCLSVPDSETRLHTAPRYGVLIRYAPSAA